MSRDPESLPLTVPGVVPRDCRWKRCGSFACGYIRGGLTGLLDTAGERGADPPELWFVPEDIPVGPAAFSRLPTPKALPALKALWVDPSRGLLWFVCEAGEK